MPTPMAKAESMTVVICSLPLRMSSVYAGTCNVIAEPKNQNHEMPSIERNTLRLRRANPTMRQVSVHAFQFILRAGSTGCVAGIPRLAR